MKGPCPSVARIAATRASSSGPPATSSSGSRLPCTGTRLLQARLDPAERHAGVAAHGVDAGFLGIALGERARAAREADDRDVPAPSAFTRSTIRLVGAMHQRANSSSGRLPAQLSKICRALGAGLDLAHQIIDRGLDQEVDQTLEARPVAIGQQPRRGLLLAAAALHHVGRNRPRRAAKADQRHVLRQVGRPRVRWSRRPARRPCAR